MISIILIVDAGSSSIRCTAHEYRGLLKSQNKGIFPRLFVIDDDKVGDVVSTSTATPTTKSTNPPKLVEALRGIGHSVPLNAILPSTGHIRVYDVLDAIDNCVDETLKLLRRMVHPESTSSNSSSLSSSSTSTSSSCGGGVDYGHRVVAVGFSSFVMNLVAVDINGDPVGEVATCSYACNRPDVVMEASD
ncbi:hypothetical protein ACHAXA_002928 [Cyclostephanos tholiformis]|uniref:Uncharacterized protein n=1 Tax=Cyclostephanos tholiformis TaxID=382380 RepID=A0ABD3RXV3_9STRA